MFMTKRVFRKFGYSEIDDFAAFLTKMAKEGWHFKEWKWGLVFEKGEPEDVIYAVEIFIKGSGWDLRPDKDTDEFAEYCKAAGWEFVDYCRKLLIFKKISDDADEIVTAKEHFENAGKEELKNIFSQLLCWGLIAGINLKSSFIDSFYYNIFNSAMLLILAVYFIGLFGNLLYAVKITSWYLKNRKLVADGFKVYVGKGELKQKKKHQLESVLSIIIVAILFVALLMERAVGYGISLLVFVLLLFSCLSALEYLRPSKNEYIVSVVAISFLVPILFAFVVFMDSDNENIYKEKNLAPLLQEDYREVEYEFEELEMQKASNLFGEISYFNVEYFNHAENEEDESCDSIDYIVINSENDWIIENCWKQLTERDDETDYYECTDEWKAEYAIKYDDWLDTYCVRYEDQILIFKFEPKLTTEQMDIIREKLNLGQVM